MLFVFLSSKPEYAWDSLAATLPVNLAAPIVTGTGYVGLTLSTTDGWWLGNPAPTFTYQWQRFNGSAWVDIGGETAATHLVVLADEGVPVRCAVTATTPAGSVAAFSNSIEQWVPTDAPAVPQHWYDAMDASTITVATGISAWANKGSLGGSLAQATALNQPAYNLTGFNGKPAAVFDGVNDGLVSTTTDDTWRNTGYGSLHMAMHPTDAAGTRALFGSSNATIGRLSIREFGGSYQIIGTRLDTDTLGFSSGGPIVAETTSFSFRQRWATTAFTVRRNGTTAVNSARLTAGVTSDTPSTVRALGTRTVGSGDHFQGPMGEVFTYAVDLSDDDMDRIDGYLAWRWGLEDKLPALHPYKAAAPTFMPLDGLSVMPNVLVGMRRLVSTYTGPIIRVRRVSDNVEQDIGYTSNGTLDTAALLAFVGQGDGRISVWYDQSGAANNLTVYSGGLAVRQPRIVAAGVIDSVLPGKPGAMYIPTVGSPTTSNHMSSVSPVTVPLSSTCVMFAAARTVPTTVQYCRLFALAQNRNTSNDWDNLYGIAPIEYRTQSALASEFYNIVSTTIPLTVGNVFRSRASFVRSAGGALTLQLNSGTAVSALRTLNNIGASYVRLGCGVSVSDQEQWSGPIGFATVWASAPPSAGDEAKVAAYLRAEYNVS